MGVPGSLGVAAHETSHAIQHNLGYIPLGIRNAIFHSQYRLKDGFSLILYGFNIQPSR